MIQTTFRTPLRLNADSTRAISGSRPVGAPWSPLDGPSRSSAQLDGIDSGRSAEMTFQVARDLDTSSTSQRSCSGPRIPGWPGPVDGPLGPR